ncbi:MAG: hypothetical protein ACLQFR_15370 [Streptosporangiaceae bacterium]
MCVGMLATIAGTASYLHMYLLAELHGQPGCGRGAHSFVGGRDDRRRVDDAAGRLAQWRPGRVPAMGAWS